MNWASVSDFLAMGGYGFYVWGSYGVCLLVFVVEPLIARARHRKALRAVGDEE
ncbi:heme exporter protein D [Inhella inkyongensis]|uniref:Heme exporter protein D n=1 Tax=Inhella inkyongensis TaxID=392593 RepID=A0A840S9E0_9BURK|nr:heme exporter protein CcmD [Inhella inkyongensis]MBB5205029.1 heme exporter protein D [Inhella inkyongensis]